MAVPVRIFDYALDSIWFSVCQQAPETGGALFGVAGLPVITHFVYDEAAVTSGVTYTPSAELVTSAREIEIANPAIEWKGVLHSHPGSLDRPSGPDHHAFAAALGRNPQLSEFIAPIVTFDHKGEKSGHELDFGDRAKLSLYSVYRERDGGCRSHPRAVECLQLRQSLTRASRVREMSCNAPQFNADGSARVVLEGSEGKSYALLVPLGFPLMAPTLLGADKSGSFAPVPLRWPIEVSPIDRLAVALADVFAGAADRRPTRRARSKRASTRRHNQKRSGVSHV